MALVLKRIVSGYWLFEEIADPRDHNYILSSSAIYPFVIILGYIYIVKNLGPHLMKDRTAFEIKNILIAYNLAQIILNGHLVYVILRSVGDTNWSCEPLDLSYSQKGLNHLYISHYYYYLKLFDGLDTIFFLLRKSYRQISFLHVYHHSGVIFASWVGVRVFPGGHGIWFFGINSLVHIVMYSYYLLTAIDEKWKTNYMVKRTLTQIQIVQFLLVIFIYGRLVFKPDCEYPKLVSYLWVPQNILMVFMFADFYRKTYLKKRAADFSK